MSDPRIDTWTVTNLLHATFGTHSENTVKSAQILIPEFQRRLVWDKKKQKALIESIIAGYPIGSLLLSQDEEAKRQTESNSTYYKLIDGLQRTNALKDYVDDPNQFFDAKQLQPDFVDFIANRLGDSSKQGKDRVISAIVDWVRSIKQFDESAGWGTNSLTKALNQARRQDVNRTSESTEMLQLYSDESFQRKLGEFLKEIRTATDVSSKRIPIIFYEGALDQLPIIFERLNTKGTKLSKYEVFAANWFDHRQTIENEEIVDRIRKKYAKLTSRGFKTDGLDNGLDWQEREFSLFDYIFGLGQHLAKMFERLFKSVQDDEPCSEIFNLVPACLGIRPTTDEVKSKIPDRLKRINLVKLEEALVETTRFVDDALKEVLTVGNDSIHHNEFQINSILATAFQARYDKDNLSEQNRWKNKRKILKKNIALYYLYDILGERWSAHGDTTMYEDVSSGRYYDQPPKKESWNFTLDKWYEEKQTSRLYERRIPVRKDGPEVLLLKYIYAHRFTVSQNAQNLHIEHVVPVKQLQERMKSGEKWALNAVSNLALLEAGANLEKGALTFAEFWTDKLNTDSISSEEYDCQISQYEKLLICPIRCLPNSISKQTFEAFLADRWKHLKSEFFTSWREIT